MTQPDDPLSYELPDEPTVDFLARQLITDFTVYETGFRATMAQTGPIAEQLKRGMAASANMEKNLMLMSYAAGTADVNAATRVLRWAYTVALNGLDPSSRAASYYGKLLRQPDMFFMQALIAAQPTLAALARHYEGE